MSPPIDPMPDATDLADTPRAAGTLDWAAVTGLTIAAFDVTVDLEARSSFSPSPLSSPVVAGCSVLVGVALFFAPRAVLGLAGRFARLDPAALGPASSLAAVVACLPLLAAAWRGVDGDPASAAVAGAIGLALAGALAWPLTRLVRAFPNVRASLAAVCLITPVPLLAAAAFQSFGRSSATPVLWFALGAAALLIGSAVVGLRPRIPAGALALALLVAAVPSLDPRDSAPEESGRAEGDSPRHVLLVVVDTLRADHLSCLDDSAAPTPALDALAAGSLVFERARSAAPWTFPSMSSILSGLAPAVHLGLRPGVPLALSVPTAAQRFSTAGWRTAAFVRNPALWRTAYLDRGFDEYHFYREPRPETAVAEHVLRAVLPDVYAPRVGADVQCDDVARWYAENRDRDTFVWLHLFDPHMAYEPPATFQPVGDAPARIGRSFGDAARVRGGFLNPDAEEREWIRELYAGEVGFMDEQLGRLVGALEAEGLWEDMLVVFTSDHGEEFWEHGLFEHGQALYDETVRVPLMVKSPGGGPQGRVDTDVSNESVAPTLYALSGLPYDPDTLTSGPLLRREDDGTIELADDLDRPLPIQGILYFEDRSAIVFDGFKYIRWQVSGREELYSLADDPEEAVDLAADRPEVVARGRTLLRAHLERSEELRQQYGIVPSDSGPLDANTARDLRALGYVR